MLFTVFKSNLSGALTVLDDLRSGASATGDSICGVLAGTSEPTQGVVCSQVGVLSLGKVLGVAPGTPFKGIGSSLAVVLDTDILSCWPNMTVVLPKGTSICHGKI